MKHKIISGAALFVLVMVSQLAFGQSPRVEFADSNVHDFGEVYEGDSAVYYFEFKNTGNTVLKIKEVKTTCSCTASDWPRYPIPPGGKGSIRVEFDTHDKEEGLYAKGVNMYSNAGETNMIIYITIKKKK